jgi:hypothetical protein
MRPRSQRTLVRRHVPHIVVAETLLDLLQVWQLTAATRDTPAGNVDGSTAVVRRSAGRAALPSWTIVEPAINLVPS